jgi:hypothetical protein
MADAEDLHCIIKANYWADGGEFDAEFFGEV